MVGAGEQKLCPAGDGTKFSDDKFVMVDRIMVQYIVLLKLPRVIDEVVIDVFDNSSRISLTVYAYDDNTSDLEDSSRMNSIVPFQLAYAVSIHKA